METVPSGIASASIVGAGSLGLVFAQADHTRTTKTSAGDRQFSGYNRELTYSSPPPRPATSAVDRNAYPNNSDPLSLLNSELPTSEPRKSASKRLTGTSFTSHIFARRRKGPEEPMFEGEATGDRKESVSSRGSWLKRLSTVPNSQISSPRSSIGPESPSITFSHGSAAPILTTSDSPVQLPPNKLVKRAAPRQTLNGSPISQREPGHPHSLRRPATSRQRSATLQQQFRFDEENASRAQSRSHSPPSHQIIPLEILQSRSHVFWTHHFVSQVGRSSKDISPRDRSRNDTNFHSFYTITRRILPGSIAPPTLITAKMFAQKDASRIAADFSQLNVTSPEQTHSSMENSPEQLDSNDALTQRKPRRSLSRHFNPSPSWAKRAGSIGRRKRPSIESHDNDGNVPITGTASSHIPQRQGTTKPHLSRRQPIPSQDDGDIRLASNALSRPIRQRNCSSPLPPLTPISSFALDLAQIGSSSSSSNEPTRTSTLREGDITSVQNPATNQSIEFSSSPPVFVTTHSRLHRAQGVAPSDRASTLVGSDNETRGFYSCEDEDTDFQSETIFDSVRTATTGSVRVKNPLETMFDAVPSSGISKSKMVSLGDSTLRGSVHEVSEEEEYVATLENNGQSFEDNFAPSVDLKRSHGQAYPSSPPALPVSENFGRLSLEDDDDDDEDWARDVEDFDVGNSLSPPSSTLHSRVASPAFRTALADLDNDSSPANRSPTRPYSNLYEWSESHIEKKQVVDLSERPKTEHGMQGVVDSAGIQRRTPSLLLRTHSVPVVPNDAVSHSKSSKMTEDWGDDFFEQSDTGPDSAIAILIPPAIQASQANVLGHVGLIRDVLPIVTELKRLCSLAREKNILDGQHASLWKEAEGIIALASPDDTDQGTSPSVSPTTIDFDRETVDEQYHDCGFDGKYLDSPEEISDSKMTSFEIVPDNTTAIRRRSVLLPGDDIFGHSSETTANSPDLSRISEKPKDMKMSKPATFPRVLGKDTAAVARSVMETMHQYRSISDPLHSDLAMKSPNRMPFDTTSLRDFVNRANNLIKTLGEIVRATDRAPQASPRSPHRTESPAFTRVFTDPIASPPRRLPHTKSSTSNVGGSTDSPPTKSHGKRIHVMTVA